MRKLSDDITTPLITPRNRSNSSLSRMNTFQSQVFSLDDIQSVTIKEVAKSLGLKGTRSSYCLCSRCLMLLIPSSYTIFPFFSLYLKSIACLMDQVALKIMFAQSKALCGQSTIKTVKALTIGMEDY